MGQAWSSPCWGRELLPFCCVSLLPLRRKDFEQSDRLLLLVLERGFPSSAGKWQVKDLQKDLSFSVAQVSLLSAVGVSAFLFASVFPLLLLLSLLLAAQWSSGLIVLHRLTLTAGSQLSAPGQAFSFTGSCSWTAGLSCFSGFCLKLG